MGNIQYIVSQKSRKKCNLGKLYWTNVYTSQIVLKLLKTNPETKDSMAGGGVVTVNCFLQKFKYIFSQLQLQCQ